jgi:hypothetical protein
MIVDAGGGAIGTQCNEVTDVDGLVLREDGSAVPGLYQVAAQILRIMFGSSGGHKSGVVHACGLRLPDRS